MEKSLKNTIKNWLKKLRNYYHDKKQIIELWKIRFEVIAFILAFVSSILGIRHFWNNLINKGAGEIVTLEAIKILIESMLAVYFFFFGVLRYSVLWLLDPMTDFYKTLATIKKEGKTSPVDLSDEFEIRSNINEVDVSIIEELALEALGREQFYAKTRSSLYKRWHQSNPSVFSLIMKGNAPIGYLSLLPLSSHLHFDRDLSLNNIDNNIIDQFPNSSNYLYIEGIYLKKEFQREKVLVHHMFLELLSKIRLFAKDDYVRIYALTSFKSSRRYFIKNGFGFKKREGRLQIRYLPILKYKELDVDDGHYYEDYTISGCNEASSFFLKSLYFVIDRDKRKNKGSQPPDKVPFVQNLLQFFDTAFFEINDNNLVNSFLGKTFPFYTHSVYKREKGKFREHLLGVSYIKFDTVATKKYIPCKFYTGTKAEDKKNIEYVYNGICMFSKRYRDITMIFYPKKSLTTSKNWMEHAGELGDPPLIITGRILKDKQDEIESRIGDETKNIKCDRLLSLNLTTYSQHTATTISKIGLLHMDDEADNDPAPESFFENLEPDENSSDIKKIIKLYLMRSTKVIIKAADKIVINNKGDIEDWMRENYKSLENKINIEYELYYYKNQNDTIIGSAHIEFMENGIARLKRVYKNYKGDQEDIIEQYFGEVNIRYNEANKKFLYIKFIKMDQNSLYQHYRELFLVLFWPDDKEIDDYFDYTRGIIVGDRDVEKKGEPTISADICVLCNPTEHWNKKMNVHNTKKAKKMGFHFLLIKSGTFTTYF